MLVLIPSSMANDTGQRTETQYNKKEAMRNVLNALEEGRDHTSIPDWRSDNYSDVPCVFFGTDDFGLDFEMDFDWDFPDINIDDEFFEDLEKKLDNMERNIYKKLQDMEKRIESLSEKLSDKTQFELSV